MLLNNLFLVNERQPVYISVRRDKIITVETGSHSHDADHFQIDFTDALAIPGLINSHDHLDFNCYSVLGRNKYQNYMEWGRHIHAEFKSDINAILKIPKYLRASWGMYKNLLTGVTTVVNHGSFLKIANPLISIYQEPQALHSVQFEKKWKWKLNNPLLKNRNCVIHTGEGVDEQSFHEIDELLRYNLLKRKLIGVHGVAMNPGQAENFKALIWCPESNRVLLNKQANIKLLKDHTSVVFGTDSTLTGSWNIWQHLRFARSLNQTNDVELFNMVTDSPAKLWNLNNGNLQAEKDADIVVVRKKIGISFWENIFETNPQDILMVIHKGHIRMFDKTMLGQMSRLPVNLSKFSQLSIQGIAKFVEGDLPDLIAAIKSYNPHVDFPVDVFETIVGSIHDKDS